MEAHEKPSSFEFQCSDTWIHVRDWLFGSSVALSKLKTCIKSIRGPTCGAGQVVEVLQRVFVTPTRWWVKDAGTHNRTCAAQTTLGCNCRYVWSGRRGGLPDTWCHSLDHFPTAHENANYDHSNEVVEAHDCSSRSERACILGLP